MKGAFYIAATLAIVSTMMVITRKNVVHALLYLIVSLISVALVFFILGAAFVAALEVIIYTGAIMVLFVFVIMMLNLGPQCTQQEKEWLSPGIWVGPTAMILILASELAYVVRLGPARLAAIGAVTPKQVGIALFGPYVLGVELASMLLLAGIVGAYHLGRRDRS